MFQYRVTHQKQPSTGFVDHNLNPSPIKPSFIHNVSKYWIGLTLKTLSKALVYSITAILPCFGPENDFGPDQLQHAS